MIDRFVNHTEVAPTHLTATTNLLSPVINTSYVDTASPTFGPALNSRTGIIPSWFSCWHRETPYSIHHANHLIHPKQVTQRSLTIMQGTQRLLNPSRFRYLRQSEFLSCLLTPHLTNNYTIVPISLAGARRSTYITTPESRKSKCGPQNLLSSYILYIKQLPR